MEHGARSMTDTEPPIELDPAAVECGFMMHPKVLLEFLQSGQFNPHQALEMNQPTFWPEVRRRNQQLPLHLMCAIPTVEVSGVIQALRKMGFYEGYNIAIGAETKISLDGGATKEQLYVGFCWKSKKPEIISVRLNGVVPAKPKSSWKFW